MKISAFALIPMLAITGCAPGYDNQDLARTVVTAGVAYQVGRYVEKQNEKDDARERDRRRDEYRRDCRGSRYDRYDCRPIQREYDVRDRWRP